MWGCAQTGNISWTPSETAPSIRAGEVATDKAVGKVVLQQSHWSCFAILEKRRSLLQKRQEQKKTFGTLLVWALAHVFCERYNRRIHEFGRTQTQQISEKI